MTVPTCPKGLSAPARTLWRQVHAAWSMDDGARALLEVALRAKDRAAAARAIVDAEGMVVAVGKGVRAHPLIAVVKDAEGIFLKSWRQLGLEPPVPITRQQGPA